MEIRPLSDDKILPILGRSHSSILVTDAKNEESCTFATRPHEGVGTLRQACLGLRNSDSLNDIHGRSYFTTNGLLAGRPQV